MLLAAFPPFSTDMYLPALPSLAALWGTDETAINLTLVGFFAAFSLALLVYGPLSDRYGRKPVLMAGISLYVVASLACAHAAGPWQMVAGRVVQGLGAASAATLSLAMTKDFFSGAERERILAHMAVIVSLAPMVSPVLGGAILRFAQWPVIFYVQALLGVAAAGGVWSIKESAPATSRTLREVMAGYGRLVLDARFMILCTLMALGMAPFFCFIGGSPFIFINHFGFTEQVYSYFFAFNSAALTLGFWLCTRLLRRTSGIRIILAGYAGILVSSAVLLGCSAMGPFIVAIPMACMTMSLGLTRPPSNHFLLEQAKGDAGSAASLIMFTFFVSGALAMWLISLPWNNKISVMALTGLVASLLVLTLLPRMSAARGRAH